MVDLISFVFDFICSVPKTFDPTKFRYKYVKTLGSGSTSKVYEYYDDNLKKNVALKKIPLSDVVVNKEGYCEPGTLSILNGKHPAFLKYYDCFADPKYMSIVTEKVTGPSLYDILEQGPLSEPIIKRIFYQIVEAMKIAHENLIVHRDLKPEHIFIYNGQIKIIDWGYAASVGERKYTDVCGSPYYVAPEILNKPPIIATLNDVWALGVILHTMFTGEMLFEESRNKRHLLKKVKTFDFTINERIPEEAKKLLKNILVPYKNRYSCADILQDPWFSDLNVKLKKVNGSNTGSGTNNLYTGTTWGCQSPLSKKNS